MTNVAARIEATISGARQISGATFPELLMVRSKQQWDQLKAHPLFGTRRMIDTSLISLPLPKTLNGFCSGCLTYQELRFTAAFSASQPDGSLHLALSETGVCPSCRISSRMRFALDLIGHRINSGTVYLTEQKTNLFACVSKRNPDVIGSEYLSPSISGGSIEDGIRHEDLQNLSFEDDSIDVVICLDVLEHLPDPVRALTEINRVLKSGGAGILTFPFFPNVEKSIRRASLSAAGEVVHHLEPVYHGNPLGGGALVFNDLSWDTIDECRNRGVAAHMINYWSSYRGHFGQARFACVITK